MRTVFECIDGHTCGNPVRLVKHFKPELAGDTMSDRRQFFIRQYDWIRQGLMFEPRGHDMMSGGFVYSPIHPDHDASILFMETSGCLPMCGHGTIGIVTFAIEEKMIIPKVNGRLLLEVPAGLIKVEYLANAGKVKSVKLTNVASYLAATDLDVTCSFLGRLKVDVAYGGNFYAIIEQQENFKGIDHYSASQLITLGREVRSAVNQQYTFVHPLDASIQGCSHVLWAGQVMQNDSTARSAVIYGENAIDRSPCGTGTSARMAQWVAKGKLHAGDTFIHESIIGSRFTGKVESTTQVGSYPGIIPSIEGWARITGYNTIIIDDEDDPYAHGFQVI